MGGPSSSGMSSSDPFAYARTSSVTIAFNPDSKVRPFTLRHATDPDTPPGAAGWDKDLRGRPRSFATFEAAQAAAQSSARAPLNVTVVDLEHRQVLTDAQESQAREVRASAHALSEAIQAGGGVARISVDTDPYGIAANAQQRAIADRTSSLIEAGKLQDRYDSILDAGRKAGNDPTIGFETNPYGRIKEFGPLSESDKESFKLGLQKGISERQGRAKQ